MIARSQAQIARDISYSNSAETPLGRAMIRFMENVTGRIGLVRRAAGYRDEVAGGRDFWAVMVERYGLGLEVVGGTLDDIPRKGPLILIANHPYGILDGLMMGYLLSQLRGDFRILAHSVFQAARDLEPVILPISFDATREAQRRNMDTRRAALDYLGQGGAIGVFPGGTVSTAVKPFAPAMDPVWRGFTAKMIARSGAAVVPIFFDGTNSRLFQIASHMHYTLRMSLLLGEFRRCIDRPVRLVVGRPIPPDDLALRARDPREMMDFLRTRTYALSPKPLRSMGYGFEFEERYRRGDGGGDIR